MTSENLRKLKLHQIKFYVHKLAGTTNTKQLRRKYSADFRLKESWIACYEFLLSQRNKQQSKPETKKDFYKVSSYLPNKVVHVWFDNDGNENVSPKGDIKRFRRDFPHVEILAA